MDQKPPIKLFNWKKAILPLVVGVAVVSYRTYESWQKKGHLDAVDIWSSIIPILLLVVIIAVVGWWANKRERSE